MRIIILTGAGVSAESGLGTFRDKSGSGLWARFDPMRLATPEAFARTPEAVHEFYNFRRRSLLSAQPNAAHAALARLQRELVSKGGAATLVTQNIDDLHERGGARDVIHMHGELLKARCAACGDLCDQRADLSTADRCGACGRVGAMRPHVVWFGETPLRLEEIADALAASDLFVSIGTSGSVYPAAGFVAQAGRRDMRDQPRAIRQRRAVRSGTIRPGERDRPRLGGGDAGLGSAEPNPARRGLTAGRAEGQTP